MQRPRTWPSFLTLLLAPVLARGAGFQVGDVFVGLDKGLYQHHDRTGALIDVLDLGEPTSNGTGCAFDAAGSFYGTAFDANHLVKLAAAPPHAIVWSMLTPGTGTVVDRANESVMFTGSGDLLVGHAGARSQPGGGDGNLHRYDAAGGLLADYEVPVDVRGSDWIDLSSDQCTLFYTSEGSHILRYDVCAGRALADFARLTGPVTAYALRLLPPGDGTGGLLVAAGSDVERLDASGNVVQTYDVAGADIWFALNLDPGGTSFWSANVTPGLVYRFNLASGAVEVGPISVSGLVSGLCVYGEPTAATCLQDPPAAVSLLKGVRQVDDARFVWQAATDSATDHYNVWKVVSGDKTLIPIASAAQAAIDPAIAGVCLTVPRSSPDCLDPGVVDPPPPLLFYQVRGACLSDVEGPF